MPAEQNSDVASQIRLRPTRNSGASSLYASKHLRVRRRRARVHRSRTTVRRRGRCNRCSNRDTQPKDLSTRRFYILIRTSRGGQFGKGNRLLPERLEVRPLPSTLGFPNSQSKVTVSSRCTMDEGAAIESELENACAKSAGRTKGVVWRAKPCIVQMGSTPIVAATL
jgi:hypothetical protein